MKFNTHLCLLLLLLCLSWQTFSQQSLGINTPNPDPSAALDVSATNKGMLIPRITFANRPANPATGLLIYQTDNTPGFYYYDGSMWKFIVTGSGSISNVTANAPLSVTNGTTTPQISLSQANGSTNGFLSSTDWTTFNNKFSLPTLNQGSVLFSNGTSIAQNNSKLFWNNSNEQLGIGTSTPNSPLTVNSTNSGTGTGDWIAANFGGTAGNRVVAGIFNGEATIGAHNNGLSGWASLTLNPGGSVKIPLLASVTGERMVIVNTNGTLGSYPLPAGGTGTVTNVTAATPLVVSNGTTTPNIGIIQAGVSSNGYLSSTDWNTFNNKQNTLANANASTSGILSSTDWNTFNNKQNALPNASASASGILTSANWTTFNNKQNALSNANSTTSGILTNTDWNTFNNKFTLPSLTDGSVLFSNGTTIAQNNSNFKWNNTASRLDVSGLNDGTTGAGSTNWISGSFGGSGGNRVVLGIQNGDATIGAHNATLNGWAKLVINPGGTTAIGSLAGVGTRMVVANASGEISTQALVPSSYTNGVTQIGNAIQIGGQLNQDVRIIQNAKKLQFNSQVTNAAIDVDVNNAGSVLVVSDVWQSFTPTVTGGLETITPSIALSILNSVGYTLTVYSGEGTAGNILQQTAGTFSGLTPGLGTPQPITLGSTILLTAGVKYTFRIQTGSAVGVAVASGNYAGGISSTSSTSDFVFTTHMKAETTNFSFDNDKLAIGNITPTANLDINGTLRFRTGAGANKVLVSDAQGNASWSNNIGNISGNISGGASSNFALNDNYLSNNGTATGIKINNAGKVGLGTLPTANNQVEVSGTGGIKISSTNTGTGTSDWIASNVGGTAGDRVVSGVLNGTATIGGHSNALNAWTHLVINPAGGANSTVTIGSDKDLSPTSGNASSSLDRKVTVNGSIRQGYYSVPISVSANNVAYVTWNHNLGYGPIVMMSTDQNGGGGYMDYCTYTTYNNNANQTVFVIRNLGGNNASGNFRWILVW